MTSITMEWESRLGRRLRVRDLYILSTVVKVGGMAKAARQLAMTQPAVSAAIANLEHMLGVRLLERSPRGIEPTIYAEAMLKRSVTVFDELKQSVKDVQTLADPATGELRIGCPLNTTVLPQFIERFSKRYPRVVLHVHHVPSPAIKNPGLRERKYDLVVARLGPSLPDGQIADDLSVEYLFDDPLIIAAGPSSRWARRRTVDLAELSDAPWILNHPDCLELHRRGRSFSAAGPCNANREHFWFLHAPRESLRRQWPVRHRHAKVGGTLLFAEGLTGQIARPAMAGRNRNPEKSDIKSGGRALH